MHRELIAYQDAFVLYYLILATIGLVFLSLELIARHWVFILKYYL